ncbi:MAG: hypothetical protein HGA42_20485 [Nostocales cyanobacterium W4_Combined_metabat2_030]|nr:hypothetical protein [Nostocales cyanobacterium W4_Combined_metabat2_030]
MFEWGLRTLLLVDSSGFTGPTLASVGLTFLVPLTKPKEVQLEINNQKKVMVTSRRDSNFVVVTWLFILLFLFAWEASCYFSIKSPKEQFIGMSLHFLIGLLTYLVSLIMTGIKEIV